jgi:hypothetical protein
VAEGLALSASVKLAMTETQATSGLSQGLAGGADGMSLFYLDDGACTPSLITDVGSAGVKNCNSVYGLAEPDEITGQAVKRIQASTYGIVIEYNDRVGDVTGTFTSAPLLELTGYITEGSVEWHCGMIHNIAVPNPEMPGLVTTIPKKWLPANCRSSRVTA